MQKFCMKICIVWTADLHRVNRTIRNALSSENQWFLHAICMQKWFLHAICMQKICIVWTVQLHRVNRPNSTRWVVKNYSTCWIFFATQRVEFEDLHRVNRGVHTMHDYVGKKPEFLKTYQCTGVNSLFTRDAPMVHHQCIIRNVMWTLFKYELYENSCVMRCLRNLL